MIPKVGFSNFRKEPTGNSPEMTRFGSRNTARVSGFNLCLLLAGCFRKQETSVIRYEHRIPASIYRELRFKEQRTKKAGDWLCIINIKRVEVPLFPLAFSFDYFLNSLLEKCKCRWNDRLFCYSGQFCSTSDIDVGVTSIYTKSKES
jgi:hypothetical protein